MDTMQSIPQERLYFLRVRQHLLFPQKNLFFVVFKLQESKEGRLKTEDFRVLLAEIIAMLIPVYAAHLERIYAKPENRFILARKKGELDAVQQLFYVFLGKCRLTFEAFFGKQFNEAEFVQTVEEFEAILFHEFFDGQFGAALPEQDTEM